MPTTEVYEHAEGCPVRLVEMSCGEVHWFADVYHPDGHVREDGCACGAQAAREGRYGSALLEREQFVKDRHHAVRCCGVCGTHVPPHTTCPTHGVVPKA